MDRVDHQIVHSLIRDPRISFSVVASAIATSEQTVARRYRALVKDGALRVVGLPSAFTARERVWFVRMLCRPDAADGLADALAARGDVSWVSLASGGAEIVCMVRQPAGASSALLQRLPRTAAVQSFAAYAVLHGHTGGPAEWGALPDPLTEEQVALLGVRHPPQRPTTEIRRDDAPLVAALARDGRVSVAALARELRWPAGRVSSRLTDLLDGGAVVMDVDLAPEAFGFDTQAYLWLTVAPGDLRETGAAVAALPQTAFAGVVTGQANLLAAVLCRSDEDLYGFVAGDIGGLPGVRQVDIVPTLRRLKQAGTLMRNGRLVHAA